MSSSGIGIAGFILSLILLGLGVYVVASSPIGANALLAGVPIIFIGIITMGFFYSGFMNVGDLELGILIRRMFGEKMPQGQIVARSFDQIGIQADTLMPGLYWFNPIVWAHKVRRETIIGDNQVGQVTAIDGKPLPPGRLLGDEVECNNFQDARKFLDKGYKGPQIDYLRPGQYRINTEVFNIELINAITIKDGHLGEIVAKDGKALPSGFLVAPVPTAPEGKTIQDLFQDPQEFINLGGYRGPQLPTLQPGKYYINTLLFDVTPVEQGEVPPGYVGVVISYVGDTTVPLK